MGLRFGNAAPHPVDDGQHRQQRQQQPQPRPGRAEAQADAGPQRDRANHQRAVALAEGAVVAAAGTGQRADQPGRLDDHRQQRERPDLSQIEVRQRGQRQDQRDIGDDVAQLVQIGAQRALLAMLARQHAVDRIERHPREQP